MIGTKMLIIHVQNQMQEVMFGYFRCKEYVLSFLSMCYHGTTNPLYTLDRLRLNIPSSI